MIVPFMFCSDFPSYCLDIIGINNEEEQVNTSLMTNACSCQFMFYALKCNTPPLWNFLEVIFRVVAAIIHHDNIEFFKGNEIYSSVIKNEKFRLHLNTRT